MKLSPVLLLLMVAPALADTVRCGDKLVYEGDTTARVEARCGKPAQISYSSILKVPTYWRGDRPYRLTDQAVQIPVETWIYNFGNRRFMRKLRFEDGVLVEISTLEYGY